jgi:hypothetical protein
MRTRNRFTDNVSKGNHMSTHVKSTAVNADQHIKEEPDYQ